jgi:CheY-like chemotaxis protein
MPRVLLVEDNENQRLLYREAFQDDGYEVVEAGDGWAALQCVERQPPDVVVLDIHMPGMDGLHTLARIHDLDHKLPVVLNTAYAAYKEQFVSWIADAYVTKSSNLTDLKCAVRRVLILRRADRGGGVSAEASATPRSCHARLPRDLLPRGRAVRETSA